MCVTKYAPVLRMRQLKVRLRAAHVGPIGIPTRMGFLDVPDPALNADRE